MARSQLELQTLLEGLPGVEKAYFQPPPNQTLVYPCIVYKRSDSYVAYADNVRYLLKKRYTVTVIDRDPDSPISDLVEELPFTRIDRCYPANGLNHFVFNLYF